MTADEMSEAKHKADMDDKMKKMIREILFYALLHAKYLLSCCPVKSIKQPINQATNLSFNQSINQATNESINQSINQSINLILRSAAVLHPDRHQRPARLQLVPSEPQHRRTLQQIPEQGRQCCTRVFSISSGHGMQWDV